MLEVARALHESHAQLKRSILFVAVTAEEKGLLGSRYFAAKPTVPARSMVADVNTDMFLPIFSQLPGCLRGGRVDGKDIAAVAAPFDIRILPDRAPDRNIFIRSDQYNFIRAGVPAIMPAFAATPGSPQEKQQKDWLEHRYHAPSDDAAQPVDLTAAAKFDRLMVALIERLANADQRPQWNSDSYFRKFAQPTS
jgi:Zn-dependent M28 family amino/carboxypeptidase